MGFTATLNFRKVLETAFSHLKMYGKEITQE